MFGPFWTRGTACVCTQSPRIGTSEGIFLFGKEPMVLGELVEFGPCISAEAVRTCALIGLHMMAEENTLRSGQAARVRRLLRITSTTSITSLLKSLGKIGQVKWSIFLEDWELERVALPRNEGRVQGELGVDELSLFTVFTVSERFSCGVRGAQSRGVHLFRCVYSASVALLWYCHSKKASLSPWTGCDT